MIFIKLLLLVILLLSLLLLILSDDVIIDSINDIINNNPNIRDTKDIEHYYIIDGKPVSSSELIQTYRDANTFNKLIYVNANRFNKMVSDLSNLYKKYGIDKSNQFNHLLSCYNNDTTNSCLFVAFIKLLSILYNSKVLPYGTIWQYGSFEILFVEKWFTDVAIDMITTHANNCSSNSSINSNKDINDSNDSCHYKCLEWDKPRYYTNKFFGNICKDRDSFNYNGGVSTDPIYNINNNGNDYFGDILTDKTLPHNYYDLITSTQVIEHIFDSNKYVSTLYNALKEGGLLILTGPHVSPIHGYPDDYYRFTNNGINHILTSNNFSIIQSNEYGNVLTGVFMLLGITFFSSSLSSSSSSLLLYYYNMVGIPPEYIHYDDIYSNPDNSFIHQQFIIVAKK